MRNRSSSGEPVELNELPGLRLEDGRYELPETEFVHERFTQYGVEEGSDLCIVSPTLQSGYLDHHALAALFQDMSTLTPIFIITPNTSVRDRYEQLRNGLHYSTDKWPLATVKADHSLTYRTEHFYSDDAPPGVIFTRYSTRLPNDDISSQLRGVLYDDAVKFEPDRWEDFRDWRERNDVPSVIYYIRDPLGQVFQRVKDEVDFTWSWTPYGLRNMLDVDNNPIHVNRESVPRSTQKERQLIRQKSLGQTHQVHLCTDGSVVDAFGALWDDFEELEAAADAIDEKELYAAVGISQRAINGFSRLTAKLEYSDNYRADHGKATSLSGRIGQVHATLNALSGDAAAGRTPVEHVHHSLAELKEAIIDAGPQDWKRGAVLRAMQKIYDNDERLILVLPDEPGRDALQADLQIERDQFYAEARHHIGLHTPWSLPNAEPADYLLLYGPPKYDHRWLLRTPHAPCVGVLAYQHELGLLHSQVQSLNASLRDATPVEDNDGDHPAVVNAVSPPELFSTHEDSEVPGDPTTAGGFDGISIDIPDIESSGVEDGSKPFDDYELTDVDDQVSVEDLIRDVAGDFVTEDARYTPSEYGESSEGGDDSISSSTERVDECIDIRLTSGKAIALHPTEKIEIVNQDSGTMVEKPATAINPGEQIVAVQDRDVIREAVEKLLLESGHIDLVGFARLWKNQLKTEIERNDDSFTDFKEKLQAQGLDKWRGTYRDYYQGKITLPKAKKSLHAIAQAYEMKEVLDDFENVWKANYKIRNIKNDLIDLLKKRARNELVDRGEGDYVLDEELNIRLSDFDTADEDGNPFVQVYSVSEIIEEQTVSKGYVGRVRNIDH